MQTRVEETLKRHDRGFNCAQSVACTYCDLVGVDEEMMFRVTEAFGAGMGGMEGTCGAVSGACVLAGMKASTGNLEKPNSKAVSHQLCFCGNLLDFLFIFLCPIHSLFLLFCVFSVEYPLLFALLLTKVYYIFKSAPKNVAFFD